MASKFYTCVRFPKLTIAGVCTFANGEYVTDSIKVQSAIEQTDSFTAGTVKLVAVDEEVEIKAFDIKPSDLKKLRKAELVDVADAMDIEYGPGATRPDLISLISTELKRG